MQSVQQYKNLGSCVEVSSVLQALFFICPALLTEDTAGCKSTSGRGRHRGREADERGA